MQLQRIVGEMHSIYKIGGGITQIVVAEANIRKGGGESNPRKDDLLLPIIQLICHVVWLWEWGCARVWLSVGANAGFGVGRVCWDRTEVVYKRLCVHWLVWVFNIVKNGPKVIKIIRTFSSQKGYVYLRVWPAFYQWICHFTNTHIYLYTSVPHKTCVDSILQVWL